MPTIAEKAERFRELHARPGTFIIPNPFDVGSARILQHLGFEALATTSSGFAFTMGRGDYGVTREEAIAHSKALVDATDIPVSADLENGFGDDPDTVAETVRLAAAAGLAGCSIEDSTQRDADPIYGMEVAVERIRSAVAAARGVGRAFTLTARAENYLHGRRDLKDTIARLQAYQDAGADVLYAPGLTSIKEVTTLIFRSGSPGERAGGDAGADVHRRGPCQRGNETDQRRRSSVADCAGGGRARGEGDERSWDVHVRERADFVAGDRGDVGRLAKRPRLWVKRGVASVSDFVHERFHHTLLWLRNANAGIDQVAGVKSRLRTASNVQRHGDLSDASLVFQSFAVLFIENSKVLC